MKLWFDMLTLRDAKKLKRWWSDNIQFGVVHKYFIVPSPSNPRYWALCRETYKSEDFLHTYASQLRR
jgi:hypothetical protein